MNPRLALLCFLAVLTALRWWWNFGLDLPAEDAYLALCGAPASVAYFDGPGGVPACVALGVSLFGGDAFGAAFLWPLFAVLATCALYALVRPLAGARDALALAVLLNLLPLFNLAALRPGSALPLSAAALGALACAWRGLDKDSLLWWLAAGFLAACALLFSYGAWLLLPSLFTSMAASRRGRRHLLHPGYWLACLPSCAVFAGLLTWNAGHGWVHFIGSTLKSSLSLHWSLLPGLVVAAGTVLGPLTLVALAAAILFGWRQLTNAPKMRFLALPALVALLASLYAGLRGQPTQGPGLLAVVLLLPLLSWIPFRISRAATIIFMTAVFPASALWTVVLLAGQSRERGFIDAAVVRQIEAVAASVASQGSTPLFLIAEDAPLASAVAVNLSGHISKQPGHPPVYTLESAFADSQYALWPRYDQFLDAPAPTGLAPAADPFTEQEGHNPFVGRSALYITRQATQDLPQAITAAFGAWRLAAEISAPDGQMLRVYFCSDYQTMPL